MVFLFSLLLFSSLSPLTSLLNRFVKLVCSRSSCIPCKRMFSKHSFKTSSRGGERERKVCFVRKGGGGGGGGGGIQTSVINTHYTLTHFPLNYLDTANSIFSLDLVPSAQSLRSANNSSFLPLKSSLPHHLHPHFSNRVIFVVFHHC